MENMKAFLIWYKINAHKLSPQNRALIESELRKVKQIGDMGDIWSDFRDKVLDKLTKSAEKVAERVTENAPAIGKAVAEVQIIRENIKRADQGKPLINVTEVAGFSDIRNIVLFGGLGILAIMLLKK